MPDFTVTLTPVQALRFHKCFAAANNGDASPAEIEGWLKHKMYQLVLQQETNQAQKRMDPLPILQAEGWMAPPV